MSAVELGDDLRGWVDVYNDAARRIAELDDVKKLAREHIEAGLESANADEGLIAGQSVVRRTRVETVRLDVKAIRKAHPEIAAKCSTTSVSWRLSVLDTGDVR